MSDKTSLISRSQRKRRAFHLEKMLERYSVLARLAFDLEGINSMLARRFLLLNCRQEYSPVLFDFEVLADLKKRFAKLQIKRHIKKRLSPAQKRRA